MGQKSEAQLLLQLTSDVIAYRTHLKWGQRVNSKHCPILSKSPLVRKLIADGVVEGVREKESSWGGGNFKLTRLLHKVPRESKAICPACNQAVMHVPECSMTGHLASCRFQNLYGEVVIKPSIIKLTRRWANDKISSK